MAHPETKTVTPAAEEVDPLDGTTIEGGEVEEFTDIEVKTRRVREATARTIAISLIWILGLSAAIHYLAVFLLVLNDKTTAVEELSRFFNAWLPVVSGLVGSATTYYFTKDRS